MLSSTTFPSRIYEEFWFPEPWTPSFFSRSFSLASSPANSALGALTKASEPKDRDSSVAEVVNSAGSSNSEAVVDNSEDSNSSEPKEEVNSEEEDNSNSEEGVGNSEVSSSSEDEVDSSEGRVSSVEEVDSEDSEESNWFIDKDW